MTQLSPTALEEAAKATSISTGDEPHKLTYAHEMQCTGCLTARCSKPNIC